MKIKRFFSTAVGPTKSDMIIYSGKFSLLSHVQQKKLGKLEIWENWKYGKIGNMGKLGKLKKLEFEKMGKLKKLKSIDKKINSFFLKVMVYL